LVTNIPWNTDATSAHAGWVGNQANTVVQIFSKARIIIIIILKQ